MQIQFPGLSAKQFYFLIKQNSIQWEKLTKTKFEVEFEIFKVYASNGIRKDLNIQEFLDNYRVILSNEKKRKIKEEFIYYIKVLKDKQKLQNKVLDLSSNQLLDIDDLNISHLTIGLFEHLDIKFS
jgi:sRNA-binding regulator protein Hfq